MKSRYKTIATCLLCVLSFGSLFAQEKTPAAQSESKPVPTADAKDSKKQGGWIDLLKSDVYEKKWKVTEYGGEGPVEFKEGLLTLKPGVPLTGVNWTSEFPKENYEVRFKAQRLNGFDFLACLTFPVSDQFCSVVIGGWGGATLGISSVNGSDASENEWSRIMSFDNEKWYSFHLKVTKDQILFSVDDETMIDVPREGNQFDTRIEVIRSRPFGICNYQCITEIKDFAYRKLDEKPSAKDDASAEKPKFMRVVSNDADVYEALQTAISTYTIKSGKFVGAQVDLVGAVHVGEKSYYKELNKRFKDYDAVLFELVADPDIRIAGRKDQEGVINPVSSIQVAMKDTLELDFQLDEIDYEAKNFVHADMTPKEFMEDMQKRKDSFMSMFARVLGSSIAAQGSAGNQDAAMLAALMQPNRAIALRRVLAQQFETADMQMAGLEDANGLSTLVTERNAKAMSVLQKQLESGKRKLAIFYGAAHLDDMHLKLINDFDAELTKTDWLVAWKLK